MAKQQIQTVEELQKIESAVEKLRRNIGRADINYTVQISITNVDPRKVRYAVSMTSPAEGLAPITFIANTAEELIAQVKVAQKEIDYEAIELAYHEAQILACKRTIAGHEERIETIKNPPEEKAEDEVADESQDKTEADSK